MAVVVGAPDVDDLVEAADGEFVAVIGDVGGKVGVEPVRAAQHVVLQAELFDGLLALARLAQVRREDLGRLEPERAVLFIGIAEVGQRLNGIGHIPALMQAGLKEPLVVADAVALKVALHLRDVAVKAEARERVVAGLLVAVEVLLALLLIKQLRQLADIVSMVAVLGELDRILALDDLEVARLQTLGKLLDLVARVVDIELAPDVCAGLLQDARERIAKHAAAGVAHVHGAGRIGGDELHHILLPGEHVAAAVVRALALDAGDRVAEPLITQPEVQKARPGHLDGREIGTLELHVVHQDLRDLTGILVQRLRRGETEGRRIVAVGGILRNLHGGLHRDIRGQQPLSSGGLIGGHGQGQYLVLGALDHIHSDSSPYRFVRYKLTCRSETGAPPSVSR